MSDPNTAFWLDWDYDLQASSSGPSRYRNYLRQDAVAFDKIADDGPAAFALLAWRIATGPVMVPPLVRDHPRVLDVKLASSDWNGEMIADVRLVSPRPAPLRDARTGGGDWWRDYRLNARDTYEYVDEEDLSRGAYLLTEARLLWQLPTDTLAEVQRTPTGEADRFDQAVTCVEALVSALNREVTPVIAQLEHA